MDQTESHLNKGGFLGKQALASAAEPAAQPFILETGRVRSLA
jgi:hypothetical protein